MKVLFFLIPLVSFSVAQGKLRTEAICRQEVNKILPAKLQKQFWWKESLNISDQKVQGSRTFAVKPATHYEYAFQKDKDRVFITEATLDKKSGKVYEIAEPKCQVKVSTYSPAQERRPSQAQAAFTDQDLAQLVTTNRLGIVYVWSPGMPLSLRAIPEIKKAALAKNAHLTLLMDPYIAIRPEDLAEIAKRYHLEETDFRLARSEYLLAQGLILHYPAAFLYTQGILPRTRYVGHKKADVFSRWIDLESKRMMSEAAQ